MMKTVGKNFMFDDDKKFMKRKYLEIAFTTSLMLAILRIIIMFYAHYLMVLNVPISSECS
jgi:hypothetical protein